jgi:glycosyltransferase 2 family protein
MTRFWPLLKVLLGAGLLAALVIRLGSDAFVEAVRAINVVAVLAALGIGLLTTVFSAWRWCLVARGLGLQLRLPTAVADCYRALFLNSVLPAGVLGDVHRAVSHGKQEGDVKRGVRAVALERSAGLVVLVVVAVGVLLAQPALRSAAGGDLLPWLLAVLAVVVTVAVVVVRRSVLRTGLAGGVWLGVTLLSLAALAGYLALFVVAARAAGSQAPLGELLPLLVLALLAMGLPINIGGWGPREAVSTVAFGAVGYGATQGLTVAVVYGTLSLIACLPGLAMLLRTSSVARC